VRRQDAPAVYQPSGAVYVTRYDVLMAEGRVLGADNRAIVRGFEASVNIDTEWDFRLAELVLRQGRAPIPRSRQ
jgi:CMP-N,N'-diacetyllegionaminic acid synthase